MNQFKLVNSIIKESIKKSNSFLKSTTSNSSTATTTTTVNKNFSKNFNSSSSTATSNSKHTLNNNNQSIFNFNNNNNIENNKKFINRYTLGFLITPTILFNTITTSDSIKSYCTNTTTTTNTTTNTTNNNNNTMIDTISISDVDASAASTSSNVAEDCLSTTIDTTATTTTNVVDQAMEDREMKSLEDENDINTNNTNNNINSNNNTTSDEEDDETTQIINNINQINSNNSNNNIEESEYHLHSGICVIPHPNKRHKGGEDAYFISIDRHVIGVADGVGGWGDVGIDPSEYSNTLMEGSKIASDSDKVERDPLVIMEQGYSYSADVKGSSTCCIVVLGEERNLLSANLGDSGFLVIRNNEVIFRTREQQHAFNMPFQLGTQSIDRPIHSITASFPVEKGDLIIMGTDGVFDNLFDDEILEIGEKYDDPQTIARQVAKRAFEVGCSTTIYTPFAKNAGHNGYIYNGGKLDDITVIVSLVDDGPIRPIKPDILLEDELCSNDS